jgi:hypothetical protein
MAAALLVAAGLVACAATDASAFTLKLAFADGQPMTYGSACAGLGCMQRGDGVDTTDALGQVYLNGRPRTIEYRRDGIVLGMAPVGVASGSVVAIGDQATVVLPRLLVGSSPAVDAVESDLVARLNEARTAHGLPPAQINPRLAAAADLQATWLAQTGVTFSEPDRFHTGPFDTDMSFRHGEVSLPEPRSGGEIAEAGGTVIEAVGDWLSSAEHRALVLAPGQLLMGAARAGSFLIVETHRPCAGCVEAGPGARLNAPADTPPPIAAAAAPPPPALAAPVPTIASSTLDVALPSCGRERLATRRLRGIGGRVRLRVGMSCLRSGSRYVLLIRQGATGRVLRTLPVARARTMTLQLRPSRSASVLRIKLKRDGRAIVGRTLKLRTT